MPRFDARIRFEAIPVALGRTQPFGYSFAWVKSSAAQVPSGGVMFFTGTGQTAEYLTLLSEVLENPTAAGASSGVKMRFASTSAGNYSFASSRWAEVAVGDTFRLSFITPGVDRAAIVEFSALTAMSATTAGLEIVARARLIRNPDHIEDIVPAGIGALLLGDQPAAPWAAFDLWGLVRRTSAATISVDLADSTTTADVNREVTVELRRHPRIVDLDFDNFALRMTAEGRAYRVVGVEDDGRRYMTVNGVLE